MSAILQSNAIDFQNSESTSLAKLTASAANTFTLTGAGTNNCTLAGLAEPVNSNEAATKNYVDSVAQGLDVLEGCKVATTANLAYTYADGSGTLGAGATLENQTQEVVTIDGQALVAGERVLVKDQTDKKQNGIYTVTTVGSIGAKLLLTRTSDFDKAEHIEHGKFTFVQNGTAGGNHGFVLAGTNPYSTVTGATVSVTSGSNSVTVTAATGDKITFASANMGVEIDGEFYTTSANGDVAKDATFTLNRVVPRTASNVPIKLCNKIGSVNIEFTQFSGAASLTAEKGILQTSNTLSLNLSTVETETVDVANDFVAFLDNTDSGTKKVKIADIVSGVAGALTSNLAVSSGTIALKSAISFAGDASLTSTGGKVDLTSNSDTALTSGTTMALSSGTTMDLDAAGALSLNSSAGVINIGNDAVAQAINIGDGAAARTITVGNTTGATQLNLKSGSGKVVITGAATASSTLDVTGAVTAGSTLAVTGAVTASSTMSVADVLSVTDTTDSTSKTNGALVVAGGLGVGLDTNIGAALEVTGAVTAGSTLAVSSTGSFGGKLTCSLGSGTGLEVTSDATVGGALTVTGTMTCSSVTCSSDINLKKNITDIDNLDQILDTVSGKAYNWKKGEPTQEYGVLAQDVQKVMPDSVHVDSNNSLSVNYNHLVGVLMAAVKQQRDELRELKEKINQH